MKFCIRRDFQFALLALAATSAVYAKVALGPLQETMRAALALTDNQIAMLQGPALVLPKLLLAVPLGLMVDRCSRVRLLFAVVVVLLIGSFSTAMAANFPVLFAARSLVGLAGLALAPIAASLIADLYAPAQRGRASMVIVICQFAGVSAVFALGGALLAMFGGEQDAWRWAMLWLSAPVGVIMLAMLMLREPARSGAVIQSPSVRESFSEFWRYRMGIAPLLVAQVVAVIALSAIMTWAAPTFSRTFGLGPERTGAVMAAVLPVGGILGTIAGGLLADFCQRIDGPRRTLSVASALALSSVPAGLFAFMPEVEWTIASLGLAIALPTAICVMTGTVLVIVLPNQIRGLSIGLLTGVGAFLSLGSAPLLVSGLSGMLGGPTMIGPALSVVCVTAGAIGAAALAWGRRAFPRTAMP